MANAEPERDIVNGVEIVRGKDVTIEFDAQRCIHARFCVTGAPAVFLANVEGPWIHPDAMDAERLVRVAENCPSGAIRYRRTDAAAEEAAPPVNLAAVREAGPYAFHGDLRVAGKPAEFRATLCRCGASKNKPYCDGSHHDAAFAASGEPATDANRSAMLEARDGPLEINPRPNGPLAVTGALEIVSGTGRMVARTKQAFLCRCGASANKPFCDGSHKAAGFTAD
ncbi:MAG: CDGSH iron-sulfur domain-containing protein [Hyphomonadaceae bacterium]